MNKKIMSFTLDIEALNKFRKITAKNGLSMSFLINEFIKDWIKKNK